MRNNNSIFIAIVFIILIPFAILVLIADFANSANVYGKMLLCERNLNAIAKAIESYKAEFDSQWPESLEVMEKYYQYNRIPKCPGNRNEQETSDPWIYYYFKPLDEGIVPVCWDSKPHYNKRAKFFPSIKQWNVLYSDGNVESLSEKDVFRELFILAKKNPDVLKILELPVEQKKSKIPIYFCIAIGIGLALLFQKIKRRFTSITK